MIYDNGQVCTGLVEAIAQILATVGLRMMKEGQTHPCWEGAIDAFYSIKRRHMCILFSIIHHNINIALCQNTKKVMAHERRQPRIERDLSRFWNPM